MHSGDETIAAIGTPPGEGGISIVRISGPDALTIADRTFRCPAPLPSQRPGGTFVHGHTFSEQGDLDEALLLVMRAPHSYTREDVVEIQGHGGDQAARRNLRAVLAAGARLAEPGEFTKRAFLNGRLDLLQAEAVLDLIRARSDRAASAAVEQLAGCLSRSFKDIYDDVMGVVADLEATLDFPEDELPAGVMDDITGRLATAQDGFERLVATWDEGRLLREGARIVIAGRPNVGKSTLLNTLLGVDRAIVAEVPGTTRDTIEEGFVLDGIPVSLVDTAGLRTTSDSLEREGMRRTQTHLERADMYLIVIDIAVGMTNDDTCIIDDLSSDRCILVLNKVDLGRNLDEGSLQGFTWVETSLLDGRGVDELKCQMAGLLRRAVASDIVPRAVISERHRELLVQAGVRIREALRLLNEGRDDVVVPASARLREGLELVGTAIGRVYHDELLSSIFSRFCIGK